MSLYRLQNVYFVQLIISITKYKRGTHSRMRSPIHTYIHSLFHLPSSFYPDGWKAWGVIWFNITAFFAFASINLVHRNRMAWILGTNEYIRQQQMHFCQGMNTKWCILLNEWFSLIWLNEVLFHLLYSLFLYMHWIGSLFLYITLPLVDNDDDDDDDNSNVEWRSSQALIAIVLSYMIRWVFHVNIIKPRVKKQNKLTERSASIRVGNKERDKKNSHHGYTLWQHRTKS